MEKSEQIKIIDNFLEYEEFKKIQNIFLSQNVLWRYNDYVIEPGYSSCYNDYQFVHPFYSSGFVESDLYYVLSPIIDKLDYYIMIRCKANLLTRSETNIEHGYHIDISDLRDYHKPKTSIFYINTNNGYTKFKNGTIIESVENRMITFNTRMEHTGSTCTDEKIRVVVNFNYF